MASDIAFITAEEVQKLRAAIESDGRSIDEYKLTRDEVADLIKDSFGLESEEIYKLFMLAFDKDNNGELDFYEIINFLVRTEDTAEKDVAKRVFILFDVDKSNTIDVSELYTLCRTLMPHEGISRVEVEEAFKEIDLNRDGVLSFEEFWNFYETLN